MQSSKTTPLAFPDLLVDGRWAIAVLFGLVLLAYLPATQATYIWDDDQYVTENVQLRSADGLWKIWFEPGATPQYYPLVFSTFWVEYHLWGLHPAGFHLVNILLHALNAVLLFRILRALDVPGAMLAGALFAVAPLHVESVAWISERKNVLSTVFYLLAFATYWRFVWLREDGGASSSSLRWRSYCLSLVLFGCALMSKSVTCSLPAAVLLVLWWKKSRLTLQDVIPLLPMFAIGVAAGLNTVHMEKYHVGAAGIDWQWTPVERILIAGRVLWFYAIKLVAPQPLIFIYPKWQIDAAVWWQYAYPLSFVALVIWLWLAHKRLGRGPLVAVLYYAGTLFPALGFIDVYPMRFSFVADHFVYLASIGLIALMASGAATVAAKLSVHKTVSLVCAVAVLVVFVRISFVRCFDYLSREALWTATIAANPDCWMAYSNLGTIRFKQQRYVEASELLRRALRDKIQDEPTLDEKADMRYQLGASLYHLGKPEEGIAHFRTALELYRRVAESESPPSAETYNNLGILCGQLQQYDESIRYFQRTVELEPSRVDSVGNLAELYYRLQRLEESAASFRRVLEIDSSNVQAHYRLGTIAMAVGQRQEAVEHFREALQIDPDFSEAGSALEQVLSQ